MQINYLKKIKNIFFDLDGTIYNGNKLIAGVDKLFKLLIEKNINYYFITNNSSVTKNEYVNKISNLGIPCNNSNVYTSIDITIFELKKRKIRTIFVVGTQSLKLSLSPEFKIVDSYNGEKIDAVLVGYDKELTYKKLYDASLFLQNGCKLFSTHIDDTCPIENGYFVPDCGLITKILEKTSKKKSLSFGKPNKNFINMIIQQKKLAPENCVIIGDRLETDIKLANNANIKSIWINSSGGNKNIKNIKTTYVFASAAELIKYLK